MSDTLNVALDINSLFYAKMRSFYFVKDQDWEKYTATSKLVEPRLGRYVQDVFDRGLRSLKRNQTFTLIAHLPELKKMMLLSDLGYSYEQMLPRTFEQMIDLIEHEKDGHVIFLQVEQDQYLAVLRPRIKNHEQSRTVLGYKG